MIRVLILHGPDEDPPSTIPEAVDDVVAIVAALRDRGFKLTGRAIMRPDGTYENAFQKDYEC